MEVRSRNPEGLSGYLLRPSLTVFIGPPLSGKSTAGNMVDKLSNGKYIDIDAFRKLVIKDEELKPLYGGVFPGFMEGAAMELLYRGIYDVAGKLLTPNYEKAGVIFDLLHFEAYKGGYTLAPMPVITGATHTREPFHTIAKEAGDRVAELRGAEREDVVTFFRLHISDEEARIRLERRVREGDASNLTTFDRYLDVKNRWKPIEGEHVIDIDNSGTIEQTVAQIFGALVRKGVATPV